MGTEVDIDVQSLERLRKLGGNELISKMVTLFTSHAESAIRDAAGGIASGDLEIVRRAAHSLKSSAGNLGALRVQAVADEIEQLAEQKAGNVRPLLTDLEKAYLRAKARLNEEIQEGKDPFEDSDR